MISADEAKVCYKELAESYLRELYSIDSLENGFLNCNAIFMPPAGKKNLISLFNTPRIENLTDEEFAFLSDISEKEAKDQKVEEIINFLEQTYRKVLYLPGWEYGDGRKGEFYPNIHGDGILPVDSIIFRFRDSVPNIPLEEIDIKEEDRKLRIFMNVKVQFEKLANKEDKDYVWLLRF